MDDFFDIDLYLDPLSGEKPRGSAEQSTAALIASSMNSEYNEDWTQRQVQAPNHLVQAPNHMSQTPNHHVAAPNHLVRPPDHMVQTPNHLVPASNHLVPAPNQMVQTPTHSVKAPSLVQFDPSSYRPTPDCMNESFDVCPDDPNGLGSFGLPDGLGLPPLSAPGDNINFLPQYSNLMNYPNMEDIGGEGGAHKVNGTATYGDNGALESSTGHELLRIDRPQENTFMDIPAPCKKAFPDEIPYYTDLDFFKPTERGQKNSDGSFLSPSIEVSNQQYPSDQLNVAEAPNSKKKGKSPRKTPSKKKKSAFSDDQNVNSDSSLVNDYCTNFSEVPNFVDGTLPFPSSLNHSNNSTFPQHPLKTPEPNAPIKGKVKTPRKTPSKKKKAADTILTALSEGPSLKIKLKCEKSIGTDIEEWTVTGDNFEKLDSSPAPPAAGNSSIHRVQEDLAAEAPEATCRVTENKTDTDTRDPSLCESQPKNPSERKASNIPLVRPTVKSPSPLKISSKTKLPTAKAPSYLTGFPMRCPDYPMVYCCNHCARIFTSIRGGQLHECVKKRPGRKAGLKLR